LELEIANYTPLTKIPGKSPPMAVGPKKRPIMKGDPITKIPGGIIFLIEALVEI
jgi:hypothetical protein